MTVNRFVTAADGGTVYVTDEGDMVDQIAQAFYGRHKDMAEAIYNANRGLSALGTVLPAGIVVKLPSVVADTTPTSFKRLWD